MSEMIDWFTAAKIKEFWQQQPSSSLKDGALVFMDQIKRLQAELTQAKAEIERLEKQAKLPALDEYKGLLADLSAYKAEIESLRESVRNSIHAFHGTCWRERDEARAQLEQERERGRRLAEGIAKALDRGTSDDAEKALIAYNSTPSGEAAQERSDE